MDKKTELYKTLEQQVAALCEGETNSVAIMANVSAAIKDTMGFFWVGFYLVSDGPEPELVLGPFQGPVACYRIKKGRGVCGTAWAEERTIVVPDVEEFPGHIACSSLSRSEIVVPLYNKVGEIYGVLDIDSKELGTFDEEDAQWLERIAALLAS